MGISGLAKIKSAFTSSRSEAAPARQRGGSSKSTDTSLGGRTHTSEAGSKASRTRVSIGSQPDSGLSKVSGDDRAKARYLLQRGVITLDQANAALGAAGRKPLSNIGEDGKYKGLDSALLHPSGYGTEMVNLLEKTLTKVLDKSMTARKGGNMVGAVAVAAAAVPLAPVALAAGTIGGIKRELIDPSMRGVVDSGVFEGAYRQQRNRLLDPRPPIPGKPAADAPPPAPFPDRNPYRR